MKMSKKSASVVSFMVGMVIFVSSAMADIVTKNGYEQLKESMKQTGLKMSKEYPNFTQSVYVVQKVNGKEIGFMETVTKIDRKGNAKEERIRMKSPEGDVQKLDYSDSNTTIRWSSEDNVYFVNNSKPMESIETHLFGTTNNTNITNKYSKDMENIVDAMMGNMKNYFKLKQTKEGQKELQFSMQKEQVPALLNAITGLIVKQDVISLIPVHPERSITTQNPKLTDGFIKSVNAKMFIHSDGSLRKVTGKIVVSAKDEDGKPFELSVENLIKLQDVGNTVVKKPDLKGKEVVDETLSFNNQENLDIQSNPSQTFNPIQTVGKYKKDIVIVKDGSLIKVGEKIAEITKVEGNTIFGTLQEVYKPGYELYAKTKKDYTFSSHYDPIPYDPNSNMIFLSTATFKDIRGNESPGNVTISDATKLSISFVDKNGMYDEQLTRVFEK